MATRKSNRNSENSNQSSSRRAPGASGGTGVNRGGADARSASGGQAGSTSGDRARGAESARGGVRSGSAGIGGAAGAPSQPGATSARTANSSATGGAAGTRDVGAGAAASAQSERGREPLDRERDLQTAREGTSGGESRPRQAGTPQRAYASPVYAYGRGSPFAMMRRMMEDMDHLFSEFGITQPGLLASSFFGPDAWSDTERESEPRAALPRDATRRSLAPGARQVQRIGRPGELPSAFWAPQVEVFERGENLVIRADLPGLSREDVDVEVEDDALIIRGHRHNEFEDQREGYYRSERGYGSFYRVIPLPDGVDAEKCNATFRDGVLEVTLPRPEQRRQSPRRVTIR